jgi:hypothetical protein
MAEAPVYLPRTLIAACERYNVPVTEFTPYKRALEVNDYLALIARAKSNGGMRSWKPKPAPPPVAKFDRKVTAAEGALLDYLRDLAPVLRNRLSLMLQGCASANGEYLDRAFSAHVERILEEKGK